MTQGVSPVTVREWPQVKADHCNGCSALYIVQVILILHIFGLGLSCCIVLLKRDGTRAETRFRLSPKRTSPFKSAGASVQSTAGSRGVRISVSNVGYTTFRGSVRVLTTHSIRQFPLHFPSRASPCAIRFQTHSSTVELSHSCTIPDSTMAGHRCACLTMILVA